MVIVDVDVDGATAARSLPVPAPRRFNSLRGSCAEVLAQVLNYRHEGALEGVLATEVLVDAVVPDWTEQLARAVERLPQPRPYLLKPVQRGTAVAGDESGDPVRTLDEYTPESLFTQLYQTRRGAAPSDDVLLAFRSLVASTGGEP